MLGRGTRASAIAQALAIIILAQWMGVLAKLALFEVPALRFVWLQLAAAIASMVAYTFLWRGERWPRGRTRAEWGAMLFAGVVNFGLCRVLMTMAIERLPMNTFVFVLSFVSIATMAISSLALRERPGRIQILGVVIAIAGVRTYFAELPAPEARTGFVLAAVVVLGLAATNNVTRWVMSRSAKAPIPDVPPISPAVYSTVAILVGGLPVVLAGLATDGVPELGSARNAAIIVANGVIGIALAQTVFNHVLRTLRSFEASMIASSGLAWTALLAIPFLGEWLSARETLGVAFVMLGVALSQWRPAAQPEVVGARG